MDKIREGRDNVALLKRARHKYFTYAFVVPLMKLESPLEQSYRNTYYCCETLTERNGIVRDYSYRMMNNGEVIITSSYCKNRWCTVCNRIRTAILINAYKPVLDSWDDKYFVTLTIPNVPADKLLSAIDSLGAEFRKVKEVFYRQHRRKKRDTPLIGFRKLECTYNPERHDYHPHYHIIVRGEEMAKELLAEWLNRYPEAVEEAQNVQKADDASVMELFKYFTKLITKTKGKGSAVLIRPLDIIFQAMKGRRTFQNFGFKHEIVEDELISEEAKRLAEEIEGEAITVVYEWVQELTDWIEKQSGGVLTGYQPTPAFRQLVESIDYRRGGDHYAGKNDTNSSIGY